MAKKAAAKTAKPKASGGAGTGEKASNKSATKSEVYAELSTKTGLSKKDIANVFGGLSEMIGKELGKKGPGLFTIPGLLKIKVVRKPATKEKQGINPFTKE